MPHCSSTVIRFPFIGMRGRNLNPPISRDAELEFEDMGPGPSSTSIHILDDDSLLNVFACCRPVLSHEDEADDGIILDGGQWAWDRERWWYKPVQVCRRWRYLILGSASHLGLSLVCTYDTPVADMLLHSPPLPLIINLVDKCHHVDPEDEKSVNFALRHRDRVRRIRLLMPISTLQEYILALDGKFPILESLYIAPLSEPWNGTNLAPPKTFNAPHLCHLALDIHSYSYFRLNELLRWLSHLPQLETLIIIFQRPFLREIEWDLLHEPFVIPVTLPHLRWFGFQGNSAYLEALLPRITTSSSLLRKLQIFVFDEPTPFFPLLQQFVNATEDPGFESARLMFHEDSVSVTMYPREGTGTYALHIQVGNGQFDWQVAYAAQTLSTFDAVFSMVEHLTLEYWQGVKWSIRQTQADRTQWRDLLRTFSRVKTLRVAYHLVGDLSRALQVDEDEERSPTELLPELKELSYFTIDHARDPFASFIFARQNAGRPVTLVRHRTRNILRDGIWTAFVPSD